MPHPDAEQGLQIQLATALRERDEQKVLTDAAEAAAAAHQEARIRLARERNQAQEALAAARRECEGLRKAGDRLLVLWADFTSQETYGEHLRAGLEKSDFDDWDEAHANLRVEMER